MRRDELLATVAGSFLGARAWNGTGVVVDTPAPGAAEPVVSPVPVPEVAVLQRKEGG